MEKRAKPNRRQIGLHKVESREMRRKEGERTQKRAERRKRVRETERERERKREGAERGHGVVMKPTLT